MEFSIKEFTEQIKQNIYDNFPNEKDEIKIKKHKNTPLHIRDIALGMPLLSNGTYVFEIGNDYAEEKYPYYHILEDAEVIRKRNRGTSKSRGSQAKIEKLSSRDYGVISFNGKTYTREYQRNVRGKRSLIEKSTYIVVGSDGEVYKVNKDANYYKNIHYHYIERILDTTLPWIANTLGLKQLRTEITDLSGEYQEQIESQRIANLISQLDEEE